MLLFVVAASAVIATALLLNAAFPLRGRLANLLGLAVLAYGQIVLLAEVLSELRWIGQAGFLAGHLVLLLSALVLWWRRGRPDLRANWWFPRTDILAGLKRHRLLGIFVASVLAIAVLNLGLALIASPRYITWDPLTYHLPRAYFWWQNGTARHYPTDDIRQVEFPPNVSFSYMWIMGLSGSYRWLWLPSWLAGLVLAGSTAGLARAAGHRRAAALFAGAILLTLPLPILHMVNEYADIVMAACAACFLFFTLRALQLGVQGRPLRGNHEVLYAGLAFGLALGSKYTIFFALPASGLAVLSYGWVLLKRKALPLLLVIAASCILGFALLGSYNYVLNAFELGNPITSEEDLEEATSDLVRGGDSPEFTYFWGNLGRYVYGMLDWSLLGGRDNPIYRLHLKVVQKVNRTLGLRMGSIPGWNWEMLSFRRGQPIMTGYGPIGYLVTLASPFLLVLCLARARSPRCLLSGLLLAVGWGFLVTFSYLTAWSIYKSHHFQFLICLLLAGAVPWCYTGHRRRALWLVPIMAVAAATALWVVGIYLDRPAAPIRALQGGKPWVLGADITQEHIALLRESLPAGATVGLSGERIGAFALVEHLPELSYQPVPGEEIASALRQGTVSAVLMTPLIEVQMDRLREEGKIEAVLCGSCPAVDPGLPALPFLDHPYTRCLYVPDAMTFLWEQRKHYGFDVVQGQGGTSLAITGWSTLTSLEKGYDYGFLLVALPVPGLRALSGNRVLEVQYVGDLPRQAVQATYRGRPAAVQVAPGRLWISLGGDMASATGPLELCKISFAGKLRVRAWQEGENLPAGTIGVRSIQVIGR